MNADDPTGTEWTAAEIDLIVADYFDMLALELAQKPFVKAHRNEALQALTGRKRTSIEFKHQNISAVLQQLGMPWISGYKPMANFQRALLDAIERLLPGHGDLFTPPDLSRQTELAENEVLYYEPPPQLNPATGSPNEALENLVRKFDPAARDERNRALGAKGEERIFNSERAFLSRHEPELARNVRWISREEGDGAGYDILSFNLDGSKRLIEVKTTIGHQTTPFFISSNEVQMSESRPDEFRLVRLYDFARAPKVFEIKPPLRESVILQPSIFKAAFA
ncbi:MAG: DUF3883 domain-containing protein [Aestuariivirga sp.]